MSDLQGAGEDQQDQAPEMFTLAWRREKTQLGDLALREAQACFDDPRVRDTEAMYWIARAQAHYAAANVRVSEPRPKGWKVDMSDLVFDAPPPDLYDAPPPEHTEHMTPYHNTSQCRHPDCVRDAAGSNQEKPAQEG